jgi:hypothetical protein
VAGGFAGGAAALGRGAAASLAERPGSGQAGAGASRAGRISGRVESRLPAAHEEIRHPASAGRAGAAAIRGQQRACPPARQQARAAQPRQK